MKEEDDDDIDLALNPVQRSNAVLLVAQWTESETNIRVLADQYNISIEIPKFADLPQDHWCRTVAEQWKMLYPTSSDSFGSRNQFKWMKKLNNPDSPDDLTMKHALYVGTGASNFLSYWGTKQKPTDECHKKYLKCVSGYDY
jgi:hypothetical protein